jgi:hypothetical protein
MKFLLSYHFDRFFMVLGISVVVAWALTPLVRWVARAVGMVDQPSTRRIHTVPIPRGGGVAVFVAFHASLMITEFCTPGTLLGSLGPNWQPFFLLASFILLLVGLIDDAFDLSPWLKLAGQIFVASLMYGAGARIGTFFPADMPEAVNYALTMIWYIGIINAFNLIDGMDGLAAGLAVISALGLAVCLASRGQFSEALPLIALCGACLGFLRYNFHPPRFSWAIAAACSLGWFWRQYRSTPVPNRLSSPPSACRCLSWACRFSIRYWPSGAARCARPCQHCAVTACAPCMSCRPTRSTCTTVCWPWASASGAPPGFSTASAA